MANPILKKGGNSRYVITNVTTGTKIVLPKGFIVDSVITTKIGTTAGNFALGTTAGGVDVVNTVALGTVNAVSAKQTVIPVVPTSFVNDTTLYITNGATCDVYIGLRKIN